MSLELQAFHAFEHAGWMDPQVCSKYHERFSQVTRQSVDARGLRSEKEPMW